MTHPLEFQRFFDPFHLLSNFGRLYRPGCLVPVPLLSFGNRCEQVIGLVHSNRFRVLKLLQADLLACYLFLHSDLLPAIWSHQFWDE